MHWQEEAYKGYESLENFTPKELEEYRSHLLAKTRPQTEFIRKHVSALNSVLELCCGNGRLLIDMASEGLITRGIGVELSHSRCRFAREWVLDRHLDEILGIDEQNVLSFGQYGYYDLCVLITGAVQYFEYPTGLKKVLRLMRNSGKMGLFELYKQPHNLRSWHKLDNSDKFAWLLDDYTNDWPSRHTKTFVRRDGTVDERVEYIYYYTLEEFLEELWIVGFKKVHWAVEDASSMVVLVS